MSSLDQGRATRQQESATIASLVRGARQIRFSDEVRRLAEELDVPLTNVDPSGPDGEATEDDVRRAAKALRRQ